MTVTDAGQQLPEFHDDLLIAQLVGMDLSDGLIKLCFGQLCEWLDMLRLEVLSKEGEILSPVSRSRGSILPGQQQAKQYKVHDRYSMIRYDSV